MAFVVTLTGIRPEERFDGHPWTEARIEQAPAATGPWTALETQALSPLDSDPREPAARDLTTALATLERGWFRAVFIDAAAAERAASPVLYPPLGGALDLDELKQQAGIKRDDHDELLTRMLTAGLAYAKSRAGTGRQLEPWPADPDADPVVWRSLRLHNKRFIRIPDARDIASIVLDDVELTADDDYQLWRHPENDSPVAVVEVFSACPSICEVTGHFGFDPLPQVLKDAIYTHVARNFYKRAALFADAQVSDELGDGTYLRFLPYEVRDVYQAFRVPSDRWAIA